jgi:hypothetical protein
MRFGVVYNFKKQCFDIAVYAAGEAPDELTFATLEEATEELEKCNLCTVIGVQPEAIHA